MGVRRLPPVDTTKLDESYRLKNKAEKLRLEADKLLEQSARLRREHYSEQYDRCRACDGRGAVGEGLTSSTCSQCNSGRVPKGGWPT